MGWKKYDFLHAKSHFLEQNRSENQPVSQIVKHGSEKLFESARKFLIRKAKNCPDSLFCGL